MNNSMNNYFDALNQFLDTWLQVFKKTVKGDDGAVLADSAADNFTHVMKSFVSKLQEVSNQQQEMINNLSPEDYQKQVLESLKQFGTDLDAATAEVKSELQKEEAYVSSDAFLSDYKENAQKSQAFANAVIDGLTGLVKNVTNALEANA